MIDDAFVHHVELTAELRLRPGGLDDVDALLAIENASQPAPWTRHVFEKELQLDFSRTWVVQDLATQTLVAFLTFWIVHDEIHVLNICVAPQARRKGIARTILSELHAMARERKASLVSLEVRASNDAARRLYDSMGFIPIGRREHYYADNGEDAVILALLLEG